MNARTIRLRQESLDTLPTLTGERAALLTAFYKEHLGRHTTPVLRAKAFQHL